MLAPLRALLSHVRPRPRWWLGRAHTVVIAPAPGGGYVLKILREQGCDWVPLPARARVYDRPDVRDFAAASAALIDRGVIWVLPFGLDPDGNLTAPVQPLPREHL